MHPDVLGLHAVRVVHTPHGDERQLHLRCVFSTEGRSWWWMFWWIQVPR